MPEPTTTCPPTPSAPLAGNPLPVPARRVRTPVRRSAPHPSRGPQDYRAFAASLEHGIGIASAPKHERCNLSSSGALRSSRPLWSQLVPRARRRRIPWSRATERRRMAPRAAAPTPAVRRRTAALRAAVPRTAALRAAVPQAAGPRAAADSAVAERGFGQYPRRFWECGCFRRLGQRVHQTAVPDDNECTGIGMPGGPVIPSCSIFSSNGSCYVQPFLAVPCFQIRRDSTVLVTMSLVV